MEFLNSEVRRNKDLHGRVVPMDSEDFRTHSVGFYKLADQWCGRHSKSQPRAHSPQPKDGDMSKHVFAADSGESDLTTTGTSEDFLALALGPSCPFLSTVVTNGQPPPLKFGDVALWREHKRSDSSAVTTLCGVSTANYGLLPPVSATFAQCDQPPLCNLAVPSHFGVSAQRAGGSASQPFWSRSTCGRGDHSGPRRCKDPFC